MSSLSAFGVMPRYVLRGPTRDREGRVVCPECGCPLGGTKGSQRLTNPLLVDGIEIAAFVTLGYRCTRHAYDVIIPAPCKGESATNYPDGWRGVRVEFVDEVVRWVAVPEKEVVG